MLHSFTSNYEDLSTNAGFQFEFHCDKCGNGFKSSFMDSNVAQRSSRLDAVGRTADTVSGMLGGRLGRLSSLATRATDVARDQLGENSPEWRREHQAAFDAAQAEVRGYFTKCPGCDRWVCDDCWNGEEGLCTECAPRESAYVAQARNRAMRNNIDTAADNATVWHGKLETRTTTCPACGKPAGSGKFCNYCGSPLGTNKCPNCGATVALGLKFCDECGSPVGAKSGICPSCGYENDPNMKFCGECGSKL